MTTEEMSREFDLLYNNVMSNAAPGIDEYEKSVFLTKAQEALVTAIYDGTFEGNEKAREYIDVLVKTKTFDTDKSENVSQNCPLGVSDNSKFFKLDDAMFIVFEKLTPKDDACLKEGILVKPVKLDEYYRITQNPFKRARQKEALRLNTEGLLEIISIYKSYVYFVRYIRKPEPIILLDLTSAGLSIDGKSDKTKCELNSTIHRNIVEAAVQLAAAAYKGN